MARRRKCLTWRQREKACVWCDLLTFLCTGNLSGSHLKTGGEFGQTGQPVCLNHIKALSFPDFWISMFRHFRVGISSRNQSLNGSKLSRMQALRRIWRLTTSLLQVFSQRRRPHLHMRRKSLPESFCPKGRVPMFRLPRKEHENALQSHQISYLCLCG